jgi:hypothetical protein
VNELNYFGTNGKMLWGLLLTRPLMGDPFVIKKRSMKTFDRCRSEKSLHQRKPDCLVRLNEKAIRLYCEVALLFPPLAMPI